MKYIAPSLLAADFSKLNEEIKDVTDAGIKMLHLDVMDGVFVPNISFGIPVISSIRKCSDAIFDVHLMITEPIRYIEQFKEAGADIITVHYEACEDVKATLEKIRKNGVKVGLAISPDTEVSVLEDYIEMTDMILVMSVYPGFGGQKFIEKSLDKVRQVSKMAGDKGLSDLMIEVDGGIGGANIKDVDDAGANVFVAGSSVFRGDKEKNIKELLEIIK